MGRWNKGRTKSKAVQLGSGTGGFYNKPGDPQAVLRFSTDSQENMWSDVPIVPFKEVAAAAKLYGFRDQNDLTNVWQQVKDGGSSALALVDRKGGAVRFTVADVAGSYSRAETENNTFAFESGKQTWVEFSVSIDNTASNNTDLNIGFGDGFPATETGRPDNQLDLRIRDGGNNVTLSEVVDGAIVGIATVFLEDSVAGTLDDAYHTIGMHFEPSTNTPGTHDLFVFVDNEFQFVHAGLTLPTEPIGVYVGAQARGDRVNVEHVFVIQED